MQIAERWSCFRYSTHFDRFRPTTQNASPSQWYQRGTDIGHPFSSRYESFSNQVLSGLARNSWISSSLNPPAPEPSS